MPNISDLDLDLMVGKIAYEDGVKMGQEINRRIEAGEIPIDMDKLIITFELSEPNIPKITHILAKFCLCTFVDTGNKTITAVGIHTAGTAGMKLYKTQNCIAQMMLCFGFSSRHYCRYNR